MADETPTGDLEAKTETPEHQEPEIDVEDGQIYNFRDRDVTPMPKEPSGEPEGDKAKEAAATPAGEGVKEPEKKAEAEPEWKTKVTALEQSLQNYQAQVANLNRALHDERKKKTEEKQEEPLTQAQLDELYKLHADDPVELHKLVRYTAEQVAKSKKAETLNAVEVQERKRQADSYVMGKWKPVLDGPEGTQVRQAVDGYKRIMDIENHPLAEHLAFAVFAHENLPAIQQYWFEKGKSEALTTAADKGREKTVKDSSLAKSDKTPVKMSGTAGFEDKYKETINALGMSKGQIATMKRIMGSKGGPARVIETR